MLLSPTLRLRSNSTENKLVQLSTIAHLITHATLALKAVSSSGHKTSIESNTINLAIFYFHYIALIFSELCRVSSLFATYKMPPTLRAYQAKQSQFHILTCHTLLYRQKRLTTKYFHATGCATTHDRSQETPNTNNPTGFLQHYRLSCL